MGFGAGLVAVFFFPFLGALFFVWPTRSTFSFCSLPSASFHPRVLMPLMIARTVWVGSSPAVIQEGHHYMHHGYGSAPPPTLAWLFSCGKGDWNINRLVNQELDWTPTHKSDDSTMR